MIVPRAACAVNARAVRPLDAAPSRVALPAVQAVLSGPFAPRGMLSDETIPPARAPRTNAGPDGPRAGTAT
jgi:hypothetical protein